MVDLPVHKGRHAEIKSLLFSITFNQNWSESSLQTRHRDLRIMICSALKPKNGCKPVIERRRER